MKSQAWVGVTLLKIACLYLMAGLLIGLVLAVRQDFTLVSVHAHIGLLGWASLAIAGLVYVVLPRCAGTRLAVVHFWLHNVGLPVMMVPLTVAVLRGDAGVEPTIAAGSVMVLAGLLAFTVNVMKNARAAEVRERVQSLVGS